MGEILYMTVLFEEVIKELSRCFSRLQVFVLSLGAIVAGPVRTKKSITHHPLKAAVGTFFFLKL